MPFNKQEYQKEYHKRTYVKVPQDKRKQPRGYHSAWRKGHPEEWAIITRQNNLKVKYNLTIEQYNILLKNQDNGCAICKITPEQRKKFLVVDHDHNTGKVRGLLCDKCNLAIGHLKDSPELMEIAANYIRKSIT